MYPMVADSIGYIRICVFEHNELEEWGFLTIFAECEVSIFLIIVFL